MCLYQTVKVRVDIEVGVNLVPEWEPEYLRLLPTISRDLFILKDP